MPELPEVETIKRGLQKRIVGKKIDHIKVNWSKSFLGDYSKINGAKVLRISRLGKLLQIDLDNHFSILNHLKMTGQLVYQSSSETEKIVGGHPQKAYNQPLPHSHTHVIINFKDGSNLFFNDLRKFGYMKLVETKAVGEVPFVNKLGIDSLSTEFTPEYLKHILTNKPNSTIYQALLDQTIVAGIGNIYANEALYFAHILPTRKNKSLTQEDFSQIVSEAKRVLKLSISHGGTSDNTYRDVDGQKGNYLDFAAVYHKQNDPKKHPVQRGKLAGRSIFYCSICQS